MMFTSWEFVLLFACSVVLYYVLPRKFQKSVLLLASCCFAGYFNILFLVIALGITGITFYLGKFIGRQENDVSRKRLFCAGMVFLILFLAVFKYLGFIESNVQWLLGLVGISVDFSVKSILFPLGISFYTFQALSYLIDVYWGEEEPERSLPDFTLYMLLFMKFLSGPIERAGDFLPQAKAGKAFDYENVTYGMKLMCIGLMKKMIIADRMAPYLNDILGSVQSTSGVQLLLAGLLYPIELYADFSGYTDIAIGGAMVFGYKLSPNFNRPFTAKSITDFWRRWHMTLSFWVRDYLYQPIAASKRYWGQWGVIYALIITFVLLGLWHGGGWNFVIYGLIQGLIISYEMLAAGFRGKLEGFAGKRVFGVYSMVRTYLLFAFSLVFFRLDTLSDVWYMFSHLSLSLPHGVKELRLGMPDHDLIILIGAIILLFVYEYFMSKRDLLKAVAQQRAVVRWGIYYLFIFLFLVFGEFGSKDFIYLQF